MVGGGGGTRKDKGCQVEQRPPFTEVTDKSRRNEIGWGGGGGQEDKD